MAEIRSGRGLTFDDVLLVPRRSPVSSRRDVDTSTDLTSDIRMRIPVVSANMDTVTEAHMAIAMARIGGLGMIHRFMTTAQQVRQVEIVKRAEGFLVEAPVTIAQSSSVTEARRSMEEHDVGGLVVTGPDGALVGVVTQRDVLLAPDAGASVASVMTGREAVVTVTPGTSMDEARRLLHDHRLEKLPVMGEHGDLVGLITAQDILKLDRHPGATKDDRGRLRVGAAIGVRSADIDRAGALLDAGADVLVLDIAHGHADHCLQMLAKVRGEYPEARIVAGNVATRDGARDLADAGADAIKVGVGPGSICTTRIVTGFGVPQLTAILDSVAGVGDAGTGTPIIADGGIRTPGDMVKALAAGASSVMIGSLLAGCEEAPGSPVIRDGQKVKVVRGMASLGAALGRHAVEKGEDESAESPEEWDKVVPEGVEAVVPYRGHADEIIHQLVGGLRSGLSYGGGYTIRELQERAEFVEISAAGVRESHSHDVKRI